MTNLKMEQNLYDGLKREMVQTPWDRGNINMRRVSKSADFLMTKSIKPFSKSTYLNKD